MKKPNLLAMLTGRNPQPDKSDPWSEVVAKPPVEKPAPTAPPEARQPTPAAPGPSQPASPANKDEARLAELLNRVNRMVGPAAAPVEHAVPSPPAAKTHRGDGEAAGPRAHEHAAATALAPRVETHASSGAETKAAFTPAEPDSLEEAGLSETEVEALALKYLLARGDGAGRQIADQLKLPFGLVEAVLRQAKADQLVVYRGAAPMNDYQYQLTMLGRERAQRYAAVCTYFGAAPVRLEDYIASVQAQSLEGQHPSEADLHRAFEDLLINKTMLSRLGPAINSGRGLFLYGAPGNGKTSIAERVTRAFGQAIWIPKAIGVDGEILRVFDPMSHEPLPNEDTPNGLLEQNKIDKRWVRVRRPTIVVGGELTMNNLEVTRNPATGISEAPLQMKSNCGTLVIDDFGRQRMSTDELLNRWIVPLEKRYDFLNLANGKKLQVPFDQLIIFSTNLEPRDLVDEAFLRRIPYKIEVVDPTEQEFRALFKLMCPKLGFKYDEPAVSHLVERYYKATGRKFRCCQPRDLLMQVRNHCRYQKRDLELTPENFDFACSNYFAVM